MTTLVRALLLIVVAACAAVISGYTLGFWNLDLSLTTVFLFVTVVLLAICAGIWIACLRWTGMGAATRAGLALTFPLACFWALLRWDGSPFNDVVFALFLIPMLFLEGGVLLLLERRRMREVGFPLIADIERPNRLTP